MSMQLALLPEDIMPDQPRPRIFYRNGRTIQGHYKHGHKCNISCQAATSDKCSCECGGENHGIIHRKSRKV